MHDRVSGFGGPASGSELRTQPRVSLMLRAAKLVSPAGEYLCILRDVSTTGLKARLFHPLPPGEPIALELGNGARHLLEPVWEADGHVGFRFHEGPIQLADLVDEAGLYPKRQLRLKLDLPVQVGLGEMTLVGRLCDLSLHGALITLDQPLALRQLVRLGGPDFPARHARVRWRKGQAYGLVFHEGFSLSELAVLVERLQKPSLVKQIGIRVNH